MLVTSIHFDRPREKLQAKGASALTSAELLQILIGSGNAQVSVSRIAKKALKLLAKNGTDTTYDQLLAITGLGPAHVCQIIAAFELASRYPLSQRQLVVDSIDKLLSLVSELRTAKKLQLIYMTVDGGKRMIAKRSLQQIETSHPSLLLRKVFADVVGDNASGVMVSVGYADHPLQPTMFDLTLARDAKAMAQLFNVAIHDFLLLNRDDQRSLRTEAW